MLVGSDDCRCATKALNNMLALSGNQVVCIIENENRWDPWVMAGVIFPDTRLDKHNRIWFEQLAEPLPLGEFKLRRDEDNIPTKCSHLGERPLAPE